MASYLKEAFGSFAPHNDRDAAVKLALDLLLADGRLDDLMSLLTSGSEVGAVEGSPGWILERRDEVSNDAYRGWPKNARYRAFVDPDGYRLAFPEAFYDAAMFHRFVRLVISAYRKHNPEHADPSDRILRLAA